MATQLKQDKATNPTIYIE